MYLQHIHDKREIPKIYKEHLWINNKHKIEKKEQKTKTDTSQKGKLRSPLNIWKNARLMSKEGNLKQNHTDKFLHINQTDENKSTHSNVEYAVAQWKLLHFENRSLNLYKRFEKQFGIT